MHITIKYLAVVLSFYLTTPLFSQIKKNKIRLTVQYEKEMNHAKYLLLAARFKDNKKYVPAQGTVFLVYQNFKNDSSQLIAKATLSKKGRAKIKLHNNIDNKNLNFSFKLTDTVAFKPLVKTLFIRDGHLATRIIKEGQKNFIVAILTDVLTKEPLRRRPLKMTVKRSFKDLNLGDKDMYFTDNKGRVKILIPKGIPALNGVLTLNATLEDDTTYGTIKTFTVTPLGDTIIEETSFDARRLFSARGKEPTFLFLISISLGVIIWTAIIKVIYNIYNIYKS